MPMIFYQFKVVPFMMPSHIWFTGQEIMGDMGKALLGVGVGLVFVLLMIGVSCFIFSVVSKWLAFFFSLKLYE